MVCLQFLFLAHLVQASSGNIVFHQQVGVKANSSVATTEQTEINTESTLVCVTKCVIKPSCSSLNYNPMLKICQLILKSDLLSYILRESAEWIFVTLEGIMCPPPLSPIGWVDSVDTPFIGTFLSYRCNNGAYTVGQTNTICQPNSTWLPIPNFQCIAHIDCASMYTAGFTRSGVYPIFPNSTSSRPVIVYCDQDTDGGGWTVFQNRFDGSVDFYRDWITYKTGFGDPYGEYWIGNDMLHILTAQDDYKLRIDLTSFFNNSAYAEYSTFRVAGEEDYYHLTVAEYAGTAGDSFGFHGDADFTTLDKDNDRAADANCALRYHAGWWYKYCHQSNLNGNYTGFPTSSNPDSMSWKSWQVPSNGFWHETMKRSQMKVRPVTFRTNEN